MERWRQGDTNRATCPFDTAKKYDGSRCSTISPNFQAGPRSRLAAPWKHYLNATQKALLLHSYSGAHITLAECSGTRTRSIAYICPAASDPIAMLNRKKKKEKEEA